MEVTEFERFGALDERFAEDARTCVPVRVPENGYLDSSGRGWRCERGFVAANDTCTRLVVPPNAHIDFSGNNWDCNEPYRKTGGACIAASELR